MVAIVLAGGRARRFGADKLLHPVGGVPILRRAVEAVREVDPEVLVSVRTRAQARRYRAVVPKGTAFRVDRPASGAAGPAVGLLTCLAARSGPVLAVAGDMPWLEPASLRALLSEARRAPGGVASPLGPRGSPVTLVQAYARLPPADRLRRLVARRGPRLRASDLLRSIPSPRFVPYGRLTRSSRTFSGVNRPSDLRPPGTGRARTRRPLTIPAGVSAAFWTGVRAEHGGRFLAAGEAFLREAAAWREAGVDLLELHAVEDASRAFRSARCPERAPRDRLEALVRRMRRAVRPSRRGGARTGPRGGGTSLGGPKGARSAESRRTS